MALPGRQATTGLAQSGDGRAGSGSGTRAPWGLVGLAVTTVVVASGLHLLHQIEVRVERTRFCYEVRVPSVHLTRHTSADGQWLLRPPGRGGWILDWQVRRK